MKRLTSFFAHTVLLGASIVAGTACAGGDDLTCGEGTSKEGSKCVAESSGGGGEGGSAGSVGGSAGEGGSAGSVGGSAGSGGSGSVDQPPTFDGVEALAPASETSLQVSWEAATDDGTPTDEITYNIYVATTDGDQNFGAPTHTAPPGSRAFVVTNLTPGTDYFVVVRAVDGADNEDQNTSQLSAKPSLDQTAPTFEGATGTKTISATEIEVSWDAGSDDSNSDQSISYLVYWSDTAGGAKRGLLGAISAPGDTSAIVGGLPAADTEFYFHVQAVDAAGNSGDNDVEVSGTTGADTTPPVFGGCTGVANVTASGATLAWAPAKDDVTATDLITYNVYALPGEIDPGDPLGAPIGTFTGGTQASVVGLDPGQTYSFVCRAADASGNEDDNYSIRLETTLTDGIAPTFAGLTGLTAGSTEAMLTWNQATDDQTDDADIVYVAYFATSPSIDPMTAQKALSLPGTLGMTIPNLDSNTQYYFVVRARDAAGNEDANTVEVNAKTLVSFSLDVQPIFTANCALDMCHVPGNPPQGQILSEGFAYSNIVNVPSGQPDPRLRIDQSSTDPMDSYLYIKITGMSAFGQLMPPPESNRVLTQAQIDTIGAWIAEGALEN